MTNMTHISPCSLEASSICFISTGKRLGRISIVNGLAII